MSEIDSGRRVSLSLRRPRRRPWKMFERYFKAEKVYAKAVGAGVETDWDHASKMAFNTAIVELRAAKEAIDRLR